MQPLHLNGRKTWWWEGNSAGGINAIPISISKTILFPNLGHIMQFPKVPWITPVAMSKLFMMKQLLKFGSSWLLVIGTWCTLHQFLLPLITLHYNCRSPSPSQAPKLPAPIPWPPIFCTSEIQDHHRQPWLVQLKIGKTSSIDHTVPKWLCIRPYNHPCNLCLKCILFI